MDLEDFVLILLKVIIVVIAIAKWDYIANIIKIFY